MKLALCTIGDPAGEPEEIIGRAAEWGYDGIELWETHIRQGGVIG